MLSTENGVVNGSDYYMYTPSTLASSLFLYPVFSGYFTYEPGYCLRRTDYDNYLIMLMKKGECEVETQGQVYHAGKDQVVFINCHTPHAYWTTSGWEAIWLHFDGIQAAAYHEAILNNGSPVLTLKNLYRFEKYLQKIYRLFREKDAVKEALLNNYIVNILTELLINQDMEHSENRSYGIIEDTIAYIQDHLTGSLTLKELADHASLSPFYFSRLFKKESGYTPHEYVITARINHAKYLLKSSDISIKDICFSTGFTSESSFCTTFKKNTGNTPSEYRFSIR